MEETTGIEFQVDEQYENEKGVFTVVAIEDGEMLIRWESGEEARTDIEFQRRIQERRQQEARWAEEAEATAKSPRKSASAKPFSGLAARDFKTSGTGTRWRSRQQLGGAVTTNMDATGFKFNSWAYGNMAEMHIQDVAHRRKEANEVQARFFVKLDTEALYYGFSVAPPAAADDTGSSDWQAVTDWLAQPENETMLHSLAAEDKLIVFCPENPSFGTLRAAENGWYRDDASKSAVDDLAAHIREASKTTRCTLHIAAAVPKDKAIGEGTAVAAAIGQLFTRLLPLYRAAANR